MIDSSVDMSGYAGQTNGSGDLLIGALAHETGSLLWSLDSDFGRMEHLGFLDRYEP